jgi:hypothetical protein
MSECCDLLQKTLWIRACIFVSNHSEHVEDDLNKINIKFNANNYLGGVELIFGDQV